MELREIKKEQRAVIEKYSNMQKEKLIELCKECGLYDVDVIANSMKGRIFIEKASSLSLSDNYVINFYHYTKSGSLSKNARYLGLFIWEEDSDEKIKEKINSIFSAVL